MKIICINGSPKKENSSSSFLLDYVSKNLGQGHEIIYQKPNIGSINQDDFLDCDAIVIACPLYADGIPSHLLAWMIFIEPFLRELESKPKLYFIVNCGFYDARQNNITISIMKNWCKKSELIWGMGVGIGAGPMLSSAPFGKGPTKPYSVAIDKLIDAIKQKNIYQDIYVEPNFPRFLYMFFANMGWVSMARKNGIKKKAL